MSKDNFNHYQHSVKQTRQVVLNASSYLPVLNCIYLTWICDVHEQPCFFVLFICLWVVQSPCQFEFQSQEIWYRGALKRSFLSFTVRNNNNSNEKNHYPADYSDSPKEQSLDKSEINIVIMSRDTINWQSWWFAGLSRKSFLFPCILP